MLFVAKSVVFVSNIYRCIHGHPECLHRFDICCWIYEIYVDQPGCTAIFFLRLVLFTMFLLLGHGTEFTNASTVSLRLQNCHPACNHTKLSFSHTCHTETGLVRALLRATDVVLACTCVTVAMHMLKHNVSACFHDLPAALIKWSASLL